MHCGCVQVPPGVQSHHTIKLKGRGIKRLDIGKGDHFVHMKIRIPKWVGIETAAMLRMMFLLSRRLNPKEKELLLEYAQMEALPNGTVEGVEGGV